MARKKFEELDLCDPFLFAAALEDEAICRLILETILGRPITKVRVHAEHTILYSSDFRSVRLDIYASDEVQVEYNIEMQNEDEHNLAKRSRYYQGEMDITSLKPGEDFNDLRPCFIIFICTFDPFGKGLYRYTFENKCLETELSLGDQVQKIFLNTKGKNQESVSEKLIHLSKCGGNNRARTCDPLLVRQMLSQLSYAPTCLYRSSKFCRISITSQRQVI